MQRVTEESQLTDLIDLNDVSSWPRPLVEVLERHHDVLYRWEERHALPAEDPSIWLPDYDERCRAVAAAYDRAIYAVSDVLKPFAIRGWHCTRITDREAATIRAEGLALPDEVMLSKRIDRLVSDGLLLPDVATQLKARNQAHETNRAGMLWFCFFPPENASEYGIGRFFRHWGGEALYNSHEDDPVTSPALRAIGTPALVEADIPIALLKSPMQTAFNVTRRYAISHGCPTTEPIDHEDRIVRPLPANRLQRIIFHPEPDFLTLTGCHDWDQPIGS